MVAIKVNQLQNSSWTGLDSHTDSIMLLCLILRIEKTSAVYFVIEKTSAVYFVIEKTSAVYFVIN